MAVSGRDFINAMQGDDKRKPYVQSRLLTAEQLTQIQENPDLADQLGSPISPNHPTLTFKGQALLGLATTQPKKFPEMIKPLSTQTKDVKIVNAIEWLRWWLSADEVSRSYVGNAYEKAFSLIERVYSHIGYDAFMKSMKERGLNIDNFALIVNDTGSSMQTNYSGAEQFARSRHEVSAYGGWPGVETGPVYDAQGGIAAFHSSLKELEGALRREGEVLNQRGSDEVTYLLFKLTPRRRDIEFLAFEARVPILYHTFPRGDVGDVLTSHDFLSVDHDGIPEELKSKRIADFRNEYLTRYSPMALAMGEMIDRMNVPQKLGPSFKAAVAKPKPLVISTQANMIDAQNGAHKPMLPEGMLFQTTQYDPLENGAVDQLSHHADAIVLTPHSEAILNDWDNHFLALMDLWCSLVVNKQVNVEQLYGKPVIVLNNHKKFSHEALSNGDLDWDDPNVEEAFIQFLKEIDPAEDPWLKFIMLTKYLHEKNFVKQEPDFLYSQFAPDDSNLAEHIRKKAEAGREERITIPKYEAEFYGSDRTDMFEVSVLGSAGTRVDAYIREAEELGYWCAGKGMHVRTGGGNYGIMGAVSRGVLRFMGQHSHEPNYCHLSAIQMPRTLQFEGSCLDPKDIQKQTNKFMAVERDFDDRMASIFRSNITVAMAPGIGTYQEIVRWLRAKHAGAPHLQGQKLIIVNSVQPGPEGQRRLMDPFLEILPKHILEEDIIVVPTVRHARDIINQKHQSYLRNIQPQRRHSAVVRFDGP